MSKVPSWGVFSSIFDLVLGIAAFVWALLVAFEAVETPSYLLLSVVAVLALSMCFIESSDKKMDKLKDKYPRLKK